MYSGPRNKGSAGFGRMPPTRGRPTDDDRRPRRRRVSDREEFGGYEEGPSSLRDLMDWPFSTTRPGLFQISDADRIARMRTLDSLLSSGLNIYTDWSGFDCERWALYGIKEMFERELDKDFQFAFMRACDIAPQPQRILKHISAELDHNASCVFKDILHRLPQSALGFIDEHWPQEDDTNLEKIAKHDAICKYCFDHASELFNVMAKADCVVHSKRCHLWPTTLPQGARMNDSDGGRNTPLKVVIGTNSCTPWSLRGRQPGDADVAEIPNAVWRAERSVGLEDVFFSECTPRYPANEKLRDSLPQVDFRSIVFGANDLGHPTIRKRCMGAGLNRNTVVWIGPEDYQEDFKRRFFRTTRLNGDVYLAATSDVVQRELRRWCELRGTFYPEDKLIEGWDMTMGALPPGAASHKVLWGELKADAVSRGEALLADVMHPPNSFSAIDISALPGAEMFNTTCWLFGQLPDWH